jgi:hypothetical protein
MRQVVFLPYYVTINTFPAVTTTWKGIGLGWDNGVPSVNKKIVLMRLIIPL